MHRRDHDHAPGGRGRMQYEDQGGRGRMHHPDGGRGPFAGPFHEAFGGHGGPPPWVREGWGRGGGRGGRGRARRGDIRTAIVALLAEKPMHGYEIISELSERTEGMWRPSPGSIYPTLQLLEDEGLVVGETDPAGKRRFALTDEGRALAAEVPAGRAPWDEVSAGTPTSVRTLLRTAAGLVPVVRQVATSGSQQDCEEAARILDDARRRLYGLLAASPGPYPEGPAPEQGAQTQ